MPYPIIELEDDIATQLEQLGTKAKFWFLGTEGQNILFKEGRPNTGENWAEKVCCEICKLLNIPHANYDLAVCNGRKGVISPIFVPSGGRLIFGNELLSKFVNDYEQSKSYKARQHLLRRVMAVLSYRNVSMPLGWDSPDEVEDATGVFIGYLMLDALVGNQDRHHENWGLILVPNQGIYFAPTFDHASSLGRNETDKVRLDILNTRDIGRNIDSYANRAKSALFLNENDTKPLKTFEAFFEAKKVKPVAAQYWINRLNSIGIDDFRNILENIPDSEISQPARDFAYKMIEVNRQKILSLLESN